MSKNNPLITIGICAYKSADTAPAALESALAQDWPNLEIIVVDDGPDPETVEALGPLIERDDRARMIIHEQNKGFAGALNTVIESARGEFLAIFDDDDVSKPDRVRRQYERIIEAEKISGGDKIVCHAARTQIFENGLTRYEPTMGTKKNVIPGGEDVADRIFTGRLSGGVVGSCANCSRMARIETFRALEGYDATMRRAEDTDFNIRLAISGGHFAGIADPLVTQKMTMGQEKKLDNEYIAETNLLHKHKDYLTDKGWYDFCLSWLDVRYAYLRNEYIKMLRKMIILFFKSPLKFIKKLWWAGPALSTRASYKKWHQGKLNHE